MSLFDPDPRMTEQNEPIEWFGHALTEINLRSKTNHAAQYLPDSFQSRKPLCWRLSSGFWSTSFPSLENMMISLLQPPFDFIRSLSERLHHIRAPMKPSSRPMWASYSWTAFHSRNKANQQFSSSPNPF